MDKHEILELLEGYKNSQMEKYLVSEDIGYKAEHLGLIKGYESALILLRTLKD